MKNALWIFLVISVFINADLNLTAKEKFESKDFKYNFREKSDFPELERYLSNKKLFRSETYSEYYQQGGGYSKWEINIYSNHTFVYRYEYLRYDLFEYSDNETSRGYWEIINYGGQAYVVAQFEDGRVWYLSLEVTGGVVYLNGNKYTMSRLN